MNIRTVTIHNFRNFKDICVEFSTGFQTIVGENNIGKSNLYWAIRLVLDRDLSYNNRNLELKDFHGYKKQINTDDFISIAIELEGKNLSSLPTFHALKTAENTCKITYLYAHESKYSMEYKMPEEIDVSQFKWRLYAGGIDNTLEKILKLKSIHFSDLDGLNLFYINAFRNTNSDLFGSSRSLLSRYCQSRESSKVELASVNSILDESSKKLNNLEFIPKLVECIQEKRHAITGDYFSFPISIGFNSNIDAEAWSQLNIYFNPSKESNIPIQSLGLGQKNILYLTLFIAELENSKTDDGFNVLLIEEPEAHLHPQLQKILFSNLKNLKSTQVFMTSHSTHIASDCDYKNLNILFKDKINDVKSFAPFKDGILSPREHLLLKRYLDATRSEMFFASAIIFVEGVGEQFIIPAIAKSVFGINLTEHNISVIPIHSRYFDPFLKLVQNGNLEIPCSAIIDGDQDELGDDQEETTSVVNANNLGVDKRVLVCVGNKTLEVDLFPNSNTNSDVLKTCFSNLGHKKSFSNLLEATKTSPESWGDELINRVDQTIKKGRFAQELSNLINDKFIVPAYIKNAIVHIANCKGITIRNAE